MPESWRKRITVVSPRGHHLASNLRNMLPTIRIRRVHSRPTYHASHTHHQVPAVWSHTRQFHWSRLGQCHHLQRSNLLPSSPSRIRHEFRLPFDRTINRICINRCSDRLSHHLDQANEMVTGTWRRIVSDWDGRPFINAKRMAKLGLCSVSPPHKHGNRLHVPSYIHGCASCRRAS